MKDIGNTGNCNEMKTINLVAIFSKITKIGRQGNDSFTIQREALRSIYVCDPRFNKFQYTDVATDKRTDIARSSPLLILFQNI